jgi:hypothetical protein
MMTTTASTLRDLANEAATNLICADGSSCSNPDDCRRFAARYVNDANALIGQAGIAVKTHRLGEVKAFAVTETGKIRVWLPNGDTDLIDSFEVSPW